ncbi:TPA: phosphotransferase family protein [Klebsiella pneumoniae]
MTTDELKKALVARQLISASAELTPLTGGVSSDTYLIVDGGQRKVVKQALDTLRVAQEWRADVSRNQTEQRWLAYMQARLPGSTPRILATVADAPLFLMSYMEGYQEWKTALMAGEASASVAGAVGDLLGDMHRVSWGCPTARDQFATEENFRQLRISPYFDSLHPLYPALVPLITRCSQRLMATRQCLVHGDFSPKNLLIGQGGVVVIDGEVARYGDPVFDVAFILCHLALKTLYLGNPAPADLALLLLERYRQRQTHALDEEFSCHILLLLLLARLDGKSPAGYLTDDHCRRLRPWLLEHLASRQTTLAYLLNEVKKL